MLHYGRNSEFVRATSDFFTNILARILERAGRLHDPSSIAEFSDEAAVAVLAELTDSIEARQPLVQEATGFGTAGCIC